jgi:hypothetical protein
VGGEGEIGPGVTRPNVSCVSWGVLGGGDCRRETCAYQQEMIGMVNLGNRMVPHFLSSNQISSAADVSMLLDHAV